MNTGEDNTIHEKFLRIALDLSAEAVKKGNHPFGAVLVLDGEIMLKAENTVIIEKDVTRHAELNLVSAACRRLPAEILSRCTLYTSTEPCAMCAGAIYWAGIPRVIYACSAERLGDITGSTFVIPSREVFARGRRTTTVVGPILEEDAAQIHRSFWPGFVNKV